MAGTALGDGGSVILYTEAIESDMVTVPDLNGYFASDANILLTNAGLNMKVKGGKVANYRALVGTQSPEAGTEVPRGSVVSVEFNYTSNVH
jgi:stage V sporulation protein D (sporulation-specific penicillin-binding protein)